MKENSFLVFNFIYIYTLLWSFVGNETKQEISDSSDAVREILDANCKHDVSLEDSRDLKRSQLCVPEDRLEDLELFPDIDDDLMSLIFSSEPDWFSTDDDLFSIGRAKKSDCDNYSYGTKEGISGKRHEEIDETELPEKEIGDGNRGKKEIYENKEKRGRVCLDKTTYPVECENKHKNNYENSLGYNKASKWGDSMFLNNRFMQKEVKGKSWGLAENEVIKCKGKSWGLAENEVSECEGKRRALAENEVIKCKARRCSHCEAENTPQWRMGPMGPKTLCNACGVRYMSGRLLPEYRPAASPTFDDTKHSNFHRKILQKLQGNSRSG